MSVGATSYKLTSLAGQLRRRPTKHPGRLLGQVKQQLLLGNKDRLTSDMHCVALNMSKGSGSNSKAMYAAGHAAPRVDLTEYCGGGQIFREFKMTGEGHIVQEVDSFHVMLWM